jgi:hypothetical protein
VWRAGQLRFRLETFGLYYPALPYTAPWWRISPRHLVLFLRQSSAYARWILELDELRRAGVEATWRGRPVSANWLRAHDPPS